MPRKDAKSPGRDPATEEFLAAQREVRRHPMLAPLAAHVEIVRREGNLCPADGYAVALAPGAIHAHPTRRAPRAEWVYVLAHCLLHFGFDQFRRAPAEGGSPEWNAACDLVVTRFLRDLKLGTPPDALRGEIALPARSEEELHDRFREGGIPPEATGFGTAGAGADMRWPPPSYRGYRARRVEWPVVFAGGLAAAVTSAVNVAAGVESHLGAATGPHTLAQQARSWFISSYPLLGALAAAFTIIEDPLVCQRAGIAVAAVDAEAREVFMNPAAGLDAGENRFVMAHELLHVALRHAARREGRDPYLWNVACDYVINGWLVQMGLGEMPKVGGLHDPALAALSAESVYDLIVTDARRFRKLATLRGVGMGDILERGTPDWWAAGDGVELDEFYRRCLAQGLEYHEGAGRGLLPAGLVEEIRALMVPPIPWDVELARWFDRHFPPVETVRTYARMGRRQSATPDIPRPARVYPYERDAARTFGVVLDTSGSMDRALLAKALGTIAGYSAARDVPAVRVVFCDAHAYDAGYLPPEEIAGRVRVRGRGGTILQPGIDLLERAEDFPKRGPILIITDGYCDHLHVRRDHAYVLPKGHRLPFPPKGKVFAIS